MRCEFEGEWSGSEKKRLKETIDSIYSEFCEAYPKVNVSQYWIFKKDTIFRAKKNTWNLFLCYGDTIEEPEEKILKRMKWVKRAKIYGNQQ